jgi:hypothetical protein
LDSWRIFTFASPRPNIRIPPVHRKDPTRATHKRISGSKTPPFRLESQSIDQSLRGAPKIVPIIVPIKAEIMNRPTEEEVNEYGGSSMK